MQASADMSASKDEQVFSNTSNEDVRLGDLGYDQGMSASIIQAIGMLIMQSSNDPSASWVWSDSASAS